MFLSVGGVDVSAYLTPDTFSGAGKSVDSEDSQRTLDGVMHRVRIANKIDFSVELTMVPATIFQSLWDVCMVGNDYSAIYSFGTGTQTAQVYTSNFDWEGCVENSNGTVKTYKTIKFNMIGV